MDTLPATPLTVAAVQATPTPGAIAHNAGLAARLVRRAADDGAQVVVLPELFLCAYHPPTLHADPAADVPAGADGEIHDGRLDALRDAARERSTVVVVGASVRHADGRRACSAVLVERTGAALVAYDKQLLWGPEENALFTPGTTGATLLVDDWRLGLGICYDGCFPEHGRAAADDGAHGYLAPSGYVVGSAHRRDVYYAARALDNTMYVVFANSVGGAGDWAFNGGAAVYDPEGRPVVRAADEGEAVVVATLDPAELARVRTAHTMLRDRRELGGRRVLAAR
ncbi:carbon-nitrogen hydrolase family protein [Asanoa sp. WMMD1127]|uniref:carbon-nitrogen hydrolase family protein n=1 Tax=Asanoa sp. WMMD1127 TaxID=3016107 RepID=UPI00241787A3|nr:carbon-nitrogen hydrolase family protein [Asanoa sp. WMMD1127]MDG4826786.1 carbon-nitrogen hydrolase family protein [Asanoa sp. WMMD1127]